MVLCNSRKEYQIVVEFLVVVGAPAHVDPPGQYAANGARRTNSLLHFAQALVLHDCEDQLLVLVQHLRTDFDTQQI